MMHVRYPKKFVLAEGGYNWDKGNTRVRYVPLLCLPTDTYSRKADRTIYFEEHRRNTYSDVCHAKVEVPEYPVWEHRYYMPLDGEYLYSHSSSSDTYGVAARAGVQDLNISGEQASCQAWCLLSRGDAAIRCTVIATAHTRYSTRYEDTFSVYVDYSQARASTRGSDYVRVWWSRNIGMSLKRVYDKFHKYVRTEYSYMGYWSESKNMLAILGLDRLLYAYDRELTVNNVEDQAYSFALGDAPYIFRALYDYIHAGGAPLGTAYEKQKVDAIERQFSDELPDFLLHEPDAVMHGASDILFGKGFTSYWRNVLIQEAYLEAVRTVPRLNDNSISNLLEIAGFIKALVVDKKIEIPKSLGGIWLAYRYQYNTTKLDAEEAIQFVHRHMDLGDWTSLHNYGSSSHVISIDGSEDVEVTCRCVLDVSPRELDLIGKAWRALYTYGLSPSFYTVWDMIPYSFIVDWLIPVGQVLTAWDAEREYNGKYMIENTIFSLTYRRLSERGTIKFYTRWLSEQPIELRGMYFTESDPSTRTKTNRVLDIASLTIGSKEAR